VNNAGISIDGLILRYKAEDLRRVLDVDLASAFHLSKAALRPMMKQRGGSIVNMTSVVGEQGNAAQTAYAAAKAGLIGLTKALAREVGSRNIRVNAVSPGWIEIDMTRDLPEQAKKAMIEGAALGRAGTPRERWQWLLALHEAARRDAWQRGLEDVHAWLPPPIAKKFGRRLEHLGWRRDDSWTPYSVRLEAQ